MEIYDCSYPEIKIAASGVSIKINNDNHVIQDFDKSDSLMLIAKTGYISLYALHLFALKHLTISLHNLNGKLIYSKIPEMLNNHIDNRILQYGMYFKNRKEIADKIVELKRKKYNELLREY